MNADKLVEIEERIRTLEAQYEAIRVEPGDIGAANARQSLYLQLYDLRAEARRLRA